MQTWQSEFLGVGQLPSEIKPRGHSNPHIDGHFQNYHRTLIPTLNG